MISKAYWSNYRSGNHRVCQTCFYTPLCIVDTLAVQTCIHCWSNASRSCKIIGIDTVRPFRKFLVVFFKVRVIYSTTMQCRNFKFSPCRKHHMSPRPGDILGPSAKIAFSQRQRVPLTLVPALRCLRGGRLLRTCAFYGE